MPDVHDPAALLLHAVQAGDWRLVELIERILSGQPARSNRGARRACGTLVVKLGLSGGPAK